jgi:hypothetical protein
MDYTPVFSKKNGTKNCLCKKHRFSIPYRDGSLQRASTSTALENRNYLNCGIKENIKLWTQSQGVNKKNTRSPERLGRGKDR